MKNSKRVIVGAMALLSAVSVASCGSSSGGDSSSSYVDKVKVASTDDIATIPDFFNWLRRKFALRSKHRRYCYYP